MNANTAIIADCWGTALASSLFLMLADVLAAAAAAAAVNSMRRSIVEVAVVALW